ncbi:MAG: U3 snoRNP protein [Alyxoria varia]|nr:MAG: U3 snoRNP protein [Alyxoria varia]
MAPSRGGMKPQRQPSVKMTNGSGRKKSGTLSTKNYRFEPFSRRIAKINVDPVRRGTHEVLESEESDSFFRKRLEHWKDINMSEDFTEFLEDVQPLSENLPQILHNQFRIAELLLMSIRKENVYSLESLLDLVAHFAHDLGPRFENYFQETVECILNIAATSQHVDVIEWSFNCLAWLFKYLSRLLIPDLVPLYDLMAPLLGKKKQKSFVSKFAAESMSFLVRKASVSYFKSHESFDHLVQHAFADVVDTPVDQQVQYLEGIATLFAGAINGVETSISTGGPHVVRALVKHLLRMPKDESTASIELTCIQATLISTLHQTEAKEFLPIMRVLLDMTQSKFLKGDLGVLQRSCDIFFTVLGTRKATRILDWNPILQRLLDFINATPVTEGEMPSSTLDSIVRTVGLSYVYAPVEFLQPFIASFEEGLLSRSGTSPFLRVCVYVRKVDSKRFDMLLYGPLHTFSIRNWDHRETENCEFIPPLLYLSSKEAFDNPGYPWVEASAKQILVRLQNVVESLEKGTPTELSSLALANRYVQILPYIVLNDIRNEVHQLVEKLVHAALQNSQSPTHLARRFSLTRGIKSYARHTYPDNFDKHLLESVFAASQEFAPSILYLDGLSRIIQRQKVGNISSLGNYSTLMESLTKNLTDASHELRVQSIDILRCIYQTNVGKIPRILDFLYEIENMSFDIQNQRAISMSIRKISANDFRSSDPWIEKIVPAYCCGLLLVRLSPIWNDVFTVLETLCQVKSVEDFLMDIAIQWLHVEDSSQADETPRDTAPNQLELISPDLTCFNLCFLEESARQTSQEFSSASQRLETRFKADISAGAFKSSFNRAQSLRLLNSLPGLVEKRSRVFVPVFLEWFNAETKNITMEVDSASDSETMPSLPSPNNSTPTKVSRVERQSMLHVIAEFKNPVVLYKADEVRSNLLAVLSSGDREFQQLALKALFAWKDPSIRPYEPNLMSLVDGSRFRDTMLEFLGLDNDVHPVRPEHRSDLRPILFRILYGRTLSKASSKKEENPTARRKAVWDVLSHLGKEDLEAFLNIGLEPLDSLNFVTTSSDGIVQGVQFDRSRCLPLRQQFGMLKTIEDFAQTLGHHMSPFSYKVIDAVLYCLIRSSRKLGTGAKDNREMSQDKSDVGYLKSIRSQGMKCLASIFSVCPEQDWNPYAPVIYEGAIEPRLEKLPIETAESVSSLLKLFSTWSSTPEMLHLLFVGGPSVMETVARCLTCARDEVKGFIISDIIINVLSFAQPDQIVDSGKFNPMGLDDNDTKHGSGPAIPKLRNQLSEGLAATIMTETASLVELKPSRDITKESMKAIMLSSPYLSKPNDFEKLFGILLMLLQQPSKQVNLGVQSDVLNVLDRSLIQHGHNLEVDLLDRILENISPFFNIFSDESSRQKLCSILGQLSAYHDDFESSAELCSNMNSIYPTQLGAPNYDLRISALTSILKQGQELRKEVQWLPILHNLLYFMKNEDELSIRTAASSSLQQFVRHAKSMNLDKLVKGSLIPALERGVRVHSTEVRAEYVALLAEMIGQDIGDTKDMMALIGPDEESSVLHNLFHLQEHRRTRALGRLADRCGEVSSPHINRILIPMIMTIITDAEGRSQQNLIVHSLHALKALTKKLGWQALRSMLQRLALEKSRFESKTGLKVLAAVAEGYALSCQDQSAFEANLVHETPAELDADEDRGIVAPESSRQKLPSAENRSTALSHTVLDPLLEYLHYKDESEIEFRVGIAVSAVRILFTFTTDDISLRLPIIMIDVCNILKSKAQDARDSARKTLADIAALIGPKYFSFIVRQLQSTLRRGSQLHVASYSLHSLLVNLIPQCQYAELDSCLPSIIGIITEDVFGKTGQEKDAAGYVSKMREVRAKSQSYDSLELIASVTSIPNIKELFRPIKAQMKNPRAKHDKIDELLRRLREGLRRNEGVNSQQFLTLCYEILKDANFQEEQADAFSQRLKYKLAAFSLETLRRVLDKHESLKTVENLSGFMAKIAGCLRQNDEELQVTTLRLLGAIIKVPLKQLDVHAGQYIQRIRDIIEAESSTASPLAQAALRLGAALLRERRQAVYKQSHFEIHISFIIKRIGPDLEEPSRPGERDRQVAAFRFLRAVCDRGVLIPEVYEIMDTVRKIMIRSQEPPVPELARSVFQRFLLDYFDGAEDLKSPSQKGLKRQLEFLAKQVQTFPQSHGRLSIMEVLGFVFDKRGGAAKDKFLEEFYAPLVAVILMDTDERCRRYATALIKYVFQNASAQLSRNLRSRKWMALEDEAGMELRAGLRCWNIFIEARKEADGAQDYVSELSPVAETTQRLIRSFTDDDMQSPDFEGHIELLTDLLTLQGCLINALPSLVLKQTSKECWFAVLKQIKSESSTVRLFAAKLFGTLLTQAKVSGSDRIATTSQACAAIVHSMASQVIEVFSGILESDEESDLEVTKQASINLGLLANYESTKTSEHLLSTLLTKVSAAARIDRASHSMFANLESTKLLVQLCKEGDLDTLLQPEILNSMLVFIANIIDPAVPQRNPTSTQGPTAGSTTISEESAAVESLDSEVHNLSNVLQDRLGTAEYATQFQKVRHEVLARRRERKRKRQVDTVSRPERTEKIKKKKREAGRDRRKEKNKIAAGRRRGY